eukprot:926156-Pleurochrysis_carterae.AAC.1
MTRGRPRPPIDPRAPRGFGAARPMPPGWNLRCRLRPPRAVRIALVWPRARGAWRPAALPPPTIAGAACAHGGPVTPMRMLRSRSGGRAVLRAETPF